MAIHISSRWRLTAGPGAPGAGWHRLLVSPPQVDGPPVADGLNGIWFGPSQYWVGRGIVPSQVRTKSCARGIESASDVTFMDGVPGTHSALWGGGCNRTLSSKLQGIVMISTPR